MMKVYGALATALVALAACTAPVPDSGADASGVGFGDYDAYLDQVRARDAQLSGRSTTTIQGPGDDLSDSQQIANASVRAIGGTPQTGPQGDASAVLVGTVGPDGAPLDPDNVGISSEQDFEAVTAQRTIQSDAQLRRQQSAQYTVIQPEELPDRPRGTTPTPVEFAVSTSHNVGEKRYSRSGNGSKFERNCARYSSNELAQDAFLREGGPEKDPLGIDPDGDGFACGWSPAPYR